jgi:hypothetical protein
MYRCSWNGNFPGRVNLPILSQPRNPATPQFQGNKQNDVSSKTLIYYGPKDRTHTSKYVICESEEILGILSPLTAGMLRIYRNTASVALNNQLNDYCLTFIRSNLASGYQILINLLFQPSNDKSANGFRIED